MNQINKKAPDAIASGAFLFFNYRTLPLTEAMMVTSRTPGMLRR